MRTRNLLKRIKRETIDAWRTSKYLLNLDHDFFKQARGSRMVTYHGICKKDHRKFNGIFLRLDTFEKHLQFYQKYFNIVALNDFYNEYFDKNKFNICITFDDGYYNNYKYVLPLIEKYKAPASFFITAIRDAGYDILWNDYLGIVTKYGPLKSNFNDEVFIKKRNNYVSASTKIKLRDLLQEGSFAIKQKMMNTFNGLVSFRDKTEDEDFWQQMNITDIKTLAASAYATIGAHSYYHNDLTALSPEECRKDLTDSKKFLERICKKNIMTLAFPYGKYSKEVVMEAKKAGYDKLLALNFIHKEDKNDAALRERMIINPYISVVNQMYATVKGSYE